MADQVVRCSRCEEGFREPRDLALHRGRVHEDLTEAERSSFEVAREEEIAWLAAYRQRVVATIAATLVLLAYVIVLMAGYVHRAHPVFMLLPLPGIIGFAVLAYYMARRHFEEREDASSTGDGGL
jgi:hypothetical protein